MVDGNKAKTSAQSEPTIPFAEEYCPHTQALKQLQLEELRAEIARLRNEIENSSNLKALQNQVEQLQKMVEMQSSMLDQLRSKKPARVEAELSNIEQLFNNIHREVKKTRGYASCVAAAADKVSHLRTFQLLNNVFEQVYSSCSYVYEHFDEMTMDEKFYALAGVTLMLAGATILITSFVNPAAIPEGLIIGAAVATVGAYVANNGTARHTKDGEKIHETLGRAATALNDMMQWLFYAPGNAMQYAYDSFVASGSAPKDADPDCGLAAEDDPEFVGNSYDDPRWKKMAATYAKFGAALV